MRPLICHAGQFGLPLSSSTVLAYAPVMRASLDDSALMLQYKDGDDSAFETLYRRHNDALYRYLLRLCRHQHTAEDLYQETWSKIIRSRNRYRPTAKFTTFLYRIAHNCFIDHVRRNKRHRVESATDPDTTMDMSDQPAVLVEKSAARERLAAALLLLPDEQRDVFLLHEEAGLNLDAIAYVTGVSRETAKSRLRYAVKKLKGAMADPVLKSGGERSRPHTGTPG
jgi:RNA polymerase sigma-70 factor, ECF subfamily